MTLLMSYSPVKGWTYLSVVISSPDLPAELFSTELEKLSLHSLAWIHTNINIKNGVSHVCYNSDSLYTLKTCITHP